MTIEQSLPLRDVGEWELRSWRSYENPFTDVSIEATFTNPDGRAYTMPGFYDGNQTWRVRFSPNVPGYWAYQIRSQPDDPKLHRQGYFEVTPNAARGFLRTAPGQAWGFQYESGEPVFLFGDTTYNLFGMAHCGIDVLPLLQRRASQGFNLLRVRVPVSPFHPPEGYSKWQTRRTFPWGGSEQSPRFDQFNLDYFHTVDGVVRMVEQLGIGMEVIMQAWGFEFPFNSRQVFLPEWEELWMRYLVARYDAFNSVYIWTLMNEYEYYPNGDWHYKPVADRWAMRMGRWMKRTAPHDHVIAVHNGPTLPPFGRRFAADPHAVDAIMFQYWGSMGEDDAWLAASIEDQIAASFSGWSGSAVFAEYGYERNPELELAFPYHERCDVDHTRRGAWRGAFSGLGVIHGWENSWGPWAVLDTDQAGMSQLLQVRRFFTEIVPFQHMRPAQQLVLGDGAAPGCRPLAMASEDYATVIAYLPAGGDVTLSLPQGRAYTARWFDPRRGELQPALGDAGTASTQHFASPGGHDAHPYDWVLVLTAGDA
ncbi:MAG: DUF4038 domain-containing protein [Chloroflexi bacterium]|nr:DUF4038 domain-containing protein [Chloroflexota bacterium]